MYPAERSYRPFLANGEVVKVLPFLLEVGRNFRLLMLSYLFLPSFQLKFKISQTVQTIFIKFRTVILHPKVLLRAQWHQSCMGGI